MRDDDSVPADGSTPLYAQIMGLATAVRVSGDLRTAARIESAAARLRDTFADTTDLCSALELLRECSGDLLTTMRRHYVPDFHGHTS
ncbi:hypothetical protein [Amycolatopsis sp. CA-230715]|uniref:hypothetical protein n=1 Tax=Amycolatopsis sp. CA-230715 TaxID=2745196 RepID=UPI001C037CCB|nr:hypothetical protein [Amycolatopsis sp. CA-230715]QWF76959.1 hypothetical protein HUW46_00339 [Amycolatopsis sp. CA-230715]